MYKFTSCSNLLALKDLDFALQYCASYPGCIANKKANDDKGWGEIDLFNWPCIDYLSPAYCSEIKYDVECNKTKWKTSLSSGECIWDYTREVCLTVKSCFTLAPN
jgi:hypothetical protein